MNPFSYIKNEVTVKLQPSRIAGVGVFAIQDIPKGTKLFQPWLGDTGNYFLREEDLKTLPKELYRHIKDLFLYHTDYPKVTDTCITLVRGCHWVYTTPEYFINSNPERCNYDMDTRTTLQDIRIGQELFGNYEPYDRIKKIPI